MTPFAGLPAAAAAHLRAFADALESVRADDTAVWSGRSTTIFSRGPHSKVFSEARFFSGAKRPVIYILRAAPGSDVASIQQAFENAREQLPEHQFPRFNAPSHCLYVGSTENLARRLMQHLSQGPAATTMLRLGQWPSLPEFDLTVECASYEGATQDHVQALEDHLWTLEQPMFGRRGPT